MLGFQTVHGFINSFVAKEYVQRYVLINILSNFNSLMNIKDIKENANLYISYLQNKIKSEVDKEKFIFLVYACILYYDKEYDFIKTNSKENYELGQNYLRDLLVESIDEVVNLPFFNEYQGKVKNGFNLSIPAFDIPTVDPETRLSYFDIGNLWFYIPPKVFTYSIKDILFFEKSFNIKRKNNILDDFKESDLDLIVPTAGWFTSFVNEISSICGTTINIQNDQKGSLSTAYGFGAGVTPTADEIVKLIKYYKTLNIKRNSISSAKNLMLIYSKDETDKVLKSIGICQVGAVSDETKQKLVDATTSVLFYKTLGTRLNVKLLPENENFDGLTSLVKFNKQFDIIKSIYTKKEPNDLVDSKSIFYSTTTKKEKVIEALAKLDPILISNKEFQYTASAGDYTFSTIFLTLAEELSPYSELYNLTFDNQIEKLQKSQELKNFIDNILEMEFCKYASTIYENIQAEEAIKEKEEKAGGDNKKEQLNTLNNGLFSILFGYKDFEKGV